MKGSMFMMVWQFLTNMWSIMPEPKMILYVLSQTTAELGISHTGMCTEDTPASLTSCLILLFMAQISIFVAQLSIFLAQLSIFLAQLSIFIAQLSIFVAQLSIFMAQVSIFIVRSIFMVTSVFIAYILEPTSVWFTELLISQLATCQLLISRGNLLRFYGILQNCI